MRYKNEFVTLISGSVAVVLLGYLSYNAMVTRDVPVEKIVYQDKEIIVYNRNSYRYNIQGQVYSFVFKY